MGKANNLGDFMTDLADAIREKTGETEPINPQEFSQKILDIESGVTSKQPNDVDFVDYDGTILHSYSKEKFLALQEIPQLPSQKGLICQGWNWELAEAQEYVGLYGGLVIGANYITDNNATRLYIEVPHLCEVSLRIKGSSANFTIDWGDGNISEYTSYSASEIISHTYTNQGQYIISLIVTYGYISNFSTGTDSFFGSDFKNSTVLKKAEIGKGFHYNYYTFGNCTNLESITIPRENISDYADNASGVFKNCYKLKCVVIPPGASGIGQYFCQSCYSLARISFPSSMTKASSSILESAQSLSKIHLPSNLAELKSSILYRNYALKAVNIPPSVSNVASNAFNGSGITIYNFSYHAQVPPLASTSAFSSLRSTFKIIVPDALYDEWVAATNWSTYASNIIKKTDWDASQA